MNTQSPSMSDRSSPCPHESDHGHGPLTANDIDFFKQNGYLVKHNVLDPELMRQAVDLIWELLPAHFKRDDPTTWRGPVKDCCITQTIRRRRGRVKFRKCLHEVELVKDLVPRNPFIHGAIEQMLGPGMVRPARRIRGLYPTFPCPELGGKPLEAHRDRHAFHVGAVCYLQDVAIGGGAFAVWPKSHQLLYRTFSTRSMDDDDTTKVDAIMKRLTLWRRYPIDAMLRRMTRRGGFVELPGKAGDVIFWHQRLAHAGATNVSSRVRYAALCDFARSDIEDTQHLPPAENMWDDWNI